ncbi:NERD domain-containing protein [Virgibacillus halodenitrificans]|uniref:NERD domain-containing protein n=1 Tax=Virgibacillus halodenitrificans TaxID=1482 RepID=UPI000EF4EFDD|nr:NERD domain-containing protein [Virgibacillus halodenitrificans]
MAILYKDIDNNGLYDGFNENDYKTKGEKGEELVKKEIMQCLPDSYYLLNGIYTRTDDGDFTEIDHIIAHPKFLICVETKNYSGELEAINEETWGKRYKDKYVKIDSPQQQAVHHAFSLQNYLETVNLNIPIYTVVLLVNHKRCSFDNDSEKHYKSECPVVFKKDIVHLLEIIEEQTKHGESFDIKLLSDHIVDEHEGIKNSLLFGCKKAAMQEHDCEAQYQLGLMYLKGHYEDNGRLVQIKQNERAGIYWLNKASKQGHKLAKQSIRQYYKN